MTDKPHVFFFGYNRSNPECCLQQWYPNSFNADGKHFHTAEQYMMYHKAPLMGDKEVAERIAKAGWYVLTLAICMHKHFKAH